MKRSVSTSSQIVVAGATKRNTSVPEATAAEEVTSCSKTTLPPISEQSPAEHGYLLIDIGKNESDN